MTSPLTGHAEYVYYFPKENEKLVLNSATCLGCNDNLVSTDLSSFKMCQCAHLMILGGNLNLFHITFNKEFYENRSLIHIDINE